MDLRQSYDELRKILRSFENRAPGSQKPHCCCAHANNTRAHNGPLSGTTWVSQYQKGNTNLDFTGARNSEWQWHQLGRMQVCTLLQTDNHANTPHHSVFYRPDALPAAQPTASKHWRHRLPELLLAYSCLTNHSRAALVWLVMPKQTMRDHQWHVVCCNAEYLDFGMQNVCQSNVKVIF